MTESTPTQRRYLAYIRAFTDGFGLPPTESEIAEAIGVLPTTVSLMMKTLEKKGLIRRKSGDPRSLEVLLADDAIPKWKGKGIPQTNRKKNLAISETSHPRREGGGKATVYRFKITMKYITPVIWRRIETKDVPLEKLHELIQTSMGWTNSHLHQFEIGNDLYTHPKIMMDDFDAIDYTGIRISDLISQLGSKLRMVYEYDFGDGWQHDIVLEKVMESEPGAQYPRCIDGKRACPPEDVGGVPGFEDYVEAITNPKHSEHRELLAWNGPFDPNQFDAEKTTQRMKKGLPRW